jgi:glycosyltransferase involved in cell wall biosynthesis/2-polyprenyl-3-methyl-5-hydroxy-6-metoxy-1,4-benzoquinol methylase
VTNKLQRGEEAFAEGRLDEARRCFLDIVEADASHKEAINNLGVLAFQSNQPTEADKYFSRALQIDPAYEDCRRNLKLLRQGQAAEAIQPVRESKTLHDIRLAIVNPFENKFNQIYRDYFARQNEVRLVIPRSEDDLKPLFGWADLIWSTWCNEPVIMMTRQNPNTTLVTHIRSYEILSPNLMANVGWQHIDGAIFVADHIREIANQMWPDQLRSCQQRTVFNCVELDRYPFYDKRPGKNIAYVGYLNHKKGIPLLVQCIERAMAKDPTYHFHLAGSFQEPRFEVYMKHLLAEMGLTKAVSFHGWVKDVPAFLSEMDYVVSTSPWEGCPNNVIEAMACGIKPLVHNWRGSTTLFGRDLVFNTVDQFVEMLTSDQYDSKAYRDYVSEHFSATNNLPQIDNFLAEVLGRPKAQVLPESVEELGSSVLPSRSQPSDPPAAEAKVEKPPVAPAINFYQPLDREVMVVGDRKRLTIDTCRGRRVLHIGCVDAGMMEQRQAEGGFLHYHIHQVAQRVIGVDIDEAGLAVLRKQDYEVHRLDLETDFELLQKLSREVDLIVIPEVIEHLNNPGLALDNLHRTGFDGDILISVPNAFSFRAFTTLAQYQELVHPDHNYWFSPTTLKSLLRKTGFEITKSAVYYYRSDDAFGREFDGFMKTCPYYGEGIVVMARAVREKPGK